MAYGKAKNTANRPTLNKKTVRSLRTQRIPGPQAQLEAEGGEKLIIGLIAVSPALDKQIITNAAAIIETIKQADHKAKVIFVGTYNAYGNDYGSGELLPHSNELLAALSVG